MKDMAHLMAVVGVAEKGQRVEGMVLSLLSIKMKVGTTIVAMLGVEVEEEDMAFITVDAKDTIDLSLISNKMEELKQMLPHAKEANDMHVKEIYREKSIRATEARELQSRLLSFSEERDKSFAIRDEM